MSSKRKILLIGTGVAVLIGLAVWWVTVRERHIWAHTRKELHEIKLLIDKMAEKHEGDQKAEAEKKKD